MSSQVHDRANLMPVEQVPEQLHVANVSFADRHSRMILERRQVRPLPQRRVTVVEVIETNERLISPAQKNWQQMTPKKSSAARDQNAHVCFTS
jgi:hypothetical protein